MHQNTAKLALPEFNSEQLLQELTVVRSPIPVVKALLARIEDESYAYFKTSLDATTLVRHRSELIDQILKCLWSTLR